MIHVLGDSHVSVFTGLHGLAPCYPTVPPSALPALRVCHLGPFLAHSVASPGHGVRRVIARALRVVGPREPVLMVFGEIDCRCHLARLATRDRSIAQLAAELAQRYAHAGREIAGRRPLAFLRVPPATVMQLSDALFPTVGTFDERSRARVAFNSALARAARSVGAGVYGPTTALQTPDAEPRYDLFGDGVHADPRALPLFIQPLVRAGWLSANDPSTRVARSLATVKPPIDVRLRALLIDRAALTCLALGARRIALFGAGAHTRAIGLRPYELRGLQLVSILDDHPREDVMHDVRVLRPEELRERIDAVIISSDAHERAIMSRARALFEPRGVPCVPIYDDAIGPLALTSESRTVSTRRATNAS